MSEWYVELTHKIPRKGSLKIIRFRLVDDATLINFPPNLRKTRKSGHLLYKGSPLDFSSEARLEVAYEKTLHMKVIKEGRRNLIEVTSGERAYYFREAPRDIMVTSKRIAKALYLMGQ